MSDEQEFDGDEETDPGTRREPSERASVLGDLALALNGVALHCAEAARLVDSLEGAARAAYLDDLARRLGQLGDLAHEARRAMKDME